MLALGSGACAGWAPDLGSRAPCLLGTIGASSNSPTLAKLLCTVAGPALAFLLEGTAARGGQEVPAPPPIAQRRLRFRKGSPFPGRGPLWP